jgi:hypothetical protein
MTAIASSGGTVTIPATVFATAAPNRSGPSRLNTAATDAACSGCIARVATGAAIAFDASCRRLVSANANPSAIASVNPPVMRSGPSVDGPR